MVDLFGGSEKAPPRRPNGRKDRDERKTAKAHVAETGVQPDAPAIERKSKAITPEEYEAGWDALREKITTVEDGDRAQTSWLQQVLVRQAIGVELGRERLMKAALDGRCNRIKAGIIPAGRD